MRLHNPTENLMTTWTGADIQPGQTVDVEVTAAEAKWLLRHGCTEPAKPKAKPKPEAAPTTRRSTRRNFAE